MTAQPYPSGSGAWRLWRIAAAWLLALLAPAAAWAQPATPQRESAVKAAFLFKFGAFVEWPPGAFGRADEPLVIGVSGNDEVAADLEQLAAGKTVEGRRVQTRRIAEDGSMRGVHILFLGKRAAGRLREAIAAAPGPALLVTEQDDALAAGSVINFSVEGGRVRFAVSLVAAEARGIRLSSRLLAVAQAIDRRTR